MNKEKNGLTTVPKDLRYTRGHTWVKIDGDTATIGITDYAQEKLGSILLFELADVGASVTQGQPLGTVESDKATSDVMSPVNGEVIEINEDVIDAPEKANEDPYDEGWLVKVRVSDQAQLGSLMSPEDFEKYISA